MSNQGNISNKTLHDVISDDEAIKEAVRLSIQDQKDLSISNKIDNVLIDFHCLHDTFDEDVDSDWERHVVKCKNEAKQSILSIIQEERIVELRRIRHLFEIQEPTTTTDGHHLKIMKGRNALRVKALNTIDDRIKEITK